MTYVLVENPDGSGRRLELQRSLVITDQDRRLGMDTYALCNETGATYDRGVDDWSLDDDGLHVQLSGEAADTLDVDGGYVIHLVEATAPDVVRRGMDAILI